MKFKLVAYFDLWHVQCLDNKLFYGAFSNMGVAAKLASDLNGHRIANFKSWAAKPIKVHPIFRSPSWGGAATRNLTPQLLDDAMRSFFKVTND